MNPRVLFIGGEKGSWEVRGRQLAKALGGRATQQPHGTDWAWADVAVFVKQGLQKWQHEARRGRPLIWDALDYWQQPQDNGHDRAWFIADALRRADGRHALAATQAMSKDTGFLYIPHHSRPGLVPSPPRRRLEVVAYEGRVKYLGKWNRLLEQACVRLRARFVINPTSLAQADVVVAFRDEPWDGWACRQWKSGVKYVNALAAGRPVVTQPSAGFDEIQPVGIQLNEATTLDGPLQQAWEFREMAYDVGRRRAAEFSLDAITKQYRRLFQTVMRKAA